MKCKVCGGSIVSKDGQFVCESCHRTVEISHAYDDTEVVLCYVESDISGRRTKDSIIAQQIYNILSADKIKAFYSRITAADIDSDELDIAYEIAKSKAKVLLFIGSDMNTFKALINENSNLISDKTIIPVVFDMSLSNLPTELAPYQAIDYNAVGAGATLSKNLLRILNHTEIVSVYEQERIKKSKKNKIILILVIIMLIIFADAVLYVLFGTAYILPSKKYEKALSLIDDGKHTEAITVLSDIEDYKNSEDILKRVYSYYIGYYADESNSIEVHLDISDNNRTDVEVTRIIEGSGIVKIIERTQFIGNVAEFAFNDSRNNSGNASVQLLDDGIGLKIEYDSDGNSEEFFFNLNAKSDKPLERVPNVDTIKEWLMNCVDENQIKSDGFEFEYEKNLDRSEMETIHKIKNTDIRLILCTYAPEEAAANDSYDYDIEKKYSANRKLSAVGVPKSQWIESWDYIPENVLIKDNFIYMYSDYDDTVWISSKEIMGDDLWNKACMVNNDGGDIGMMYLFRYGLPF